MEERIKIESDGLLIVMELEQAKEVLQQLSPDKIFDAIKEGENSKRLIRRQIVENIRCNYTEELGELLHEFFDHESDANEYLTAEKQEKLEDDFARWCDAF